jgi:hypothetical protein
VSGKAFWHTWTQYDVKSKPEFDPICTATFGARRCFNPEHANPRPRRRQNLKSLSNFVYTIRTKKATSSTLSRAHAHTHTHTRYITRGHVTWKRYFFKEATKRVGIWRPNITSAQVTSVTRLQRFAFLYDSASPNIRTPTFRRNLSSPATILYIILLPLNRSPTDQLPQPITVTLFLYVVLQIPLTLEDHGHCFPSQTSGYGYPVMQRQMPVVFGCTAVQTSKFAR